MNADGTGEPTRLTRSEADEVDLAFSADGRQIAFASYRDDNGWNIYVIDADGHGPPQRITNEQDHQDGGTPSSPAFSPDGEWIAYTVAYGDSSERQIYRIKADGSGRRRLTYDGSNWDAAYSPDGNQIAFASDRTEDAEIFAMTDEGDGEHNLTNDRDGDDEDPAFSPDGQGIAFISDRDHHSIEYESRREIYVMDVDGSDQENLTRRDKADDVSPSRGEALPCMPSPHQVAIYEDAHYQGRCVLKGIGRYNTAADFSPLPDNSASSIRLGDNVEAVLADKTMLGGDREKFTDADEDFSDVAPTPGEDIIGDNRTSSFKVQARGSDSWKVTLDLRRQPHWIGDTGIVATAKLAEPDIPRWRVLPDRKISFDFARRPATGPSAMTCVPANCMTNRDGRISWKYDAAVADTHHIIAYYDQDANGHHDPGEPSATAAVQWSHARYLALGDSFSSGEGNSPYLAPTDTDDPENKCHRSDSAYSQHIADGLRLGNGGSFAFWACSGARIANVLRERNYTEDPQVNHIDVADAPPPDLITITIGGNDAGFGRVLKRCVLVIRDACNDDVVEDGLTLDDWVRQQINDMEAPGGDIDDLKDVYVAIKKRAPKARLLVLGYPRLFRERLIPGICSHIFPADAIWMNEITNELNAAIQRRVKQAVDEGFKDIQYVDEFTAFAGHELCTEEPWVYDFRAVGGPWPPTSFHPQVPGQDAMAGRVWSAITGRWTPG